MEKGAPPPQGGPGMYPQVPPAEYPPPPSYTPGPGPPPVAAGVPVVQTVVVGPSNFGRQPVRTMCPNCRNEVTTTTTEETGVMAYIVAGLLCFVGCFCGCCLIPLCMDSLKDIVHTCPNCNYKMGRFKSGGL